MNADTCESCGRVAEVRIADGSTWCMPCHSAALNLAYDTDLGRLIVTGESLTEDQIAEMSA